MVDVRYERHFRRFVSLHETKRYKEAELSQMVLLRRPQLSVQPVSKAEWDFVLSLEAMDVASDGEQDKRKAVIDNGAMEREIIETHGG